MQFILILMFFHKLDSKSASIRITAKAIRVLRCSRDFIYSEYTVYSMHPKQISRAKLTQEAL